MQQVENLNANILTNYIAHRLNVSMKQIGIPMSLPTDSELLEKSQWMDEETLGNSSTDFFYKRPVDYAKSSQSFDEEDIF